MLEVPVRAGADSRGDLNRMGARGDMRRLFTAQSAVVPCLVARPRPPRSEPERTEAQTRLCVCLYARKEREELSAHRLEERVDLGCIGR
jgi:hypothetical protein